MMRGFSPIYLAAVVVGCGGTNDRGPMGQVSAGLETDTPGGAADDSATSSGSDGGHASSESGGGSGTGSTGDPVTPPVKFDFGGIPDAPYGVVCGAPDPVTCDDLDDDTWHAIGLNCPGGPSVTGSYTGHPDALHVHAGQVGTYMPPTYPTQEGDKLVILSSGRASDLLIAGGEANTILPGANNPGPTLPAPLRTNAVSPTETCTDNPGLVGSGDCSNTIQAQWNQGDGANDYAELRMTVEVPAATYGLSYQFAMFSTEYPVYYQSQYNDMYVAWLESEQWTGNISFDDQGNPISLNAGFLDYKDAPNDVDCPAPCQAPELQGTAMEGHAGTRWLTTTAPVTPGEQIELVFAVFDLSDEAFDTVLLLDNFLWTCDGSPPVTIPG